MVQTVESGGYFRSILTAVYRLWAHYNLGAQSQFCHKIKNRFFCFQSAKTA